MFSSRFGSTLASRLPVRALLYRHVHSGRPRHVNERSRSVSTTKPRLLETISIANDTPQSIIDLGHPHTLPSSTHALDHSRTQARESSKPKTDQVDGIGLANEDEHVKDPPSPEDSHSPEPPFWQHIPRWRGLSREEFLEYKWQSRKSIQKQGQLMDMLRETLPRTIPSRDYATVPLSGITLNKQEFLDEVANGILKASMAVQLTPYVLSLIDWSSPRDDPIFQEFVPIGSSMLPDHPALTLDSLHEKDDEVVPGLVHRYPDKVLFLAATHCNVYCRYCTRSYAVGPQTATVQKDTKLPLPKKWEPMLAYIRDNPQIHDVVVSGGDAFMVDPRLLKEVIGERLLAIPHIKRIRFATRGLAVCPMRFIDDTDLWTRNFLDVHAKGRSRGVEVALHTHFTHPNEISWVTKRAARKLFDHGVRVRNQTVLLRGINDDLKTMSTLIRSLADINVDPYYVYQGDMVKSVEDLRTPLWKINWLEQQIRGTISGFKIPQFVIDLPGGGGKRLACSYEWYNRETGLSAFKAPGVSKSGDPDKLYYYHDPVDRDE